MEKKGFTLIELLAVIVILSVITLITVPMITSVIEESKKKTLVSSVQGVLDATDYFTMSHDAGVYEFLFDREHQGSTVKGESLDYKGSIDGEGKLYIDKEGNTSICISNDKYYAYKNYNSEIMIGERNSGNCIIGFDALTNKYIAMLDDGTGQVSNVYSKNEIDNLVDGLDTKIETNTNEISTIKNNIEELKNNLNNYALQSELEKNNINMENLSSAVSNNMENISSLNGKLEKLSTMHYYKEGERISLELPITRGYFIVGYGYGASGNAETIFAGILSFSWTDVGYYSAIIGENLTISAKSENNTVKVSYSVGYPYYYIISAYKLS